MKVLICDPNQSTAQTLSGALEIEGFDVLVAKNAEDARVKIILESPDFILIDWLEFDLQHMDIKNFSKQVKRIRPNTIFIFIGHKSQRDNISDFENMVAKKGADSYLLKPFSLMKVVEKLKNFQLQN